MPQLSLSLDELLKQSLATGAFRLLVFSSPKLSAAAPGNLDAEILPRKVRVRRIELQNEPVLQWAEQCGAQERHKNLPLADSIDRAAEIFGTIYKQAQLFTAEADFAFRVTSSGVKITRAAATRGGAAATTHDRAKAYLIPEGTLCPFLFELGVMTAQGQVRAAMAHKFRQINRFLEFVQDIVCELPQTGRLRVADFGCGKSYLTFAVHHLLSVVHGREVDIVGYDRNKTLVRDCTQVATKLGLRGIRFQAGDISGVECANLPAELSSSPSKTSEPFDRTLSSQLDLALVLHACDTATDSALKSAVHAQSQVILAAPCCQHELAPLIQSPALSSVLQHGILRERLAALLTDALRAEALEAAGYRALVMEFVDLEDSHKNLLIRAVRRPPNAQLEAQAQVQYAALKTTLGLGAIHVDGII